MHLKDKVESFVFESFGNSFTADTNSYKVLVVCKRSGQGTRASKEVTEDDQMTVCR